MLNTSSSLAFAVPVPHRPSHQSIQQFGNPCLVSYLPHPHSLSAPFIIRDTIDGAGKKAHTALVVCHCFLTEIPETARMNYIHVYTNDSIYRLCGAAAAICRFAAHVLKFAGRLSYRTTSTIAEFRAKSLALEDLLHHSAPSKSYCSHRLTCRLASAAKCLERNLERHLERQLERQLGRIRSPMRRSTRVAIPKTRDELYIYNEHRHLLVSKETM